MDYQRCRHRVFLSTWRYRQRPAVHDCVESRSPIEAQHARNYFLMQTFMPAFERYVVVYREIERIRRLTTNIDYSFASFIPADSTNIRQHLTVHACIEPKRSNAPGHTRFLTVADIYFAAGAIYASAHDNDGTTTIDDKRWCLNGCRYPSATGDTVKPQL